MKAMESIGSFTFVLHSHLPYVLSHGRWPHGTDWLNEASAETYVPLINVIKRLASEGIASKITLGVTPILAEQLSSPVFVDGFISYLKQKIEASRDDIKEFERHGQKDLTKLAVMWESCYADIYESFVSGCRSDIIGELRRLKDSGAVEIITSAATHGYLPLLGYDECVRAQIETGARTHTRHFGTRPSGIWLPECAYRPGYFWEFPVEGTGEGYRRRGIEEFLSDAAISYFVVDSHLLEGGKAVGAYLDRFDGLKEIWDRFMSEYRETVVDEPRSPYESYAVSSFEGPKTASIFTRDPKSALVVWSGEHGYPGDGNYLDFHKKHFPGGNRYWKVTGSKVDLGDKQVYDPRIIQDRIQENAGHFAGLVRNTLSDFSHTYHRPGIVTAPYDTELFGHWWFEGPRFIYQVIKEFAADPKVRLTTLTEHHESFPPRRVVSIPEGSWGEGGFHWIWFNDWTKWTWKHIYEAEKTMIDLADGSPKTANPGLPRVLAQAARELLLLESSDWQFLISTWSARDYAEMRFSEHYNDFTRLAGIARRIIDNTEPTTGDWEFVGDMEMKDGPFADLDIGLWKSDTP
jgi:1,4-alpha-glucan branching enzyme